MNVLLSIMLEVVLLVKTVELWNLTTSVHTTLMFLFTAIGNTRAGFRYPELLIIID